VVNQPLVTSHERVVSEDGREYNAPMLPLVALDTLWLQVTGTLCNLACRHCFISCGPKNDSHAFMTVGQVQGALDTAGQTGLKEIYFTGGEPFMHPEIFDLIERSLLHAPLTILTNGILIDDESATRLARIFSESRYSFDLRVSLDGTTAAVNDPIRGGGSFEKILDGVGALARAGLNPVLTVTEVDDGANVGSRDAFRELLLASGLPKPRMKFLAPFRIGREERRGRAYQSYELLEVEDLLPGEENELQCSSCRMVTAKGAYPCPILIEVPDARMGDSLEDALRPITLKHRACWTCHADGVSCRT
jgi:MoaA/NifB/PqqE/SkfB family radical SAM enzyme